MPKNTEAPIEALRLGFILERGGLSVQSRELAKRKDIGNPMSFLFEEGYEVILFELFILVASRINKGKFTGEESNLKVKDARFSDPSKLAHAFYECSWSFNTVFGFLKEAVCSVAIFHCVFFGHLISSMHQILVHFNARGAFFRHCSASSIALSITSSAGTT